MRRDPDTEAEARRLGEALASLRQGRGLSQADAGARMGVTGQGWGLYETGRRAGIFRPDIQRRLLAALSASPEDLALELARLAEPEAKASARGLSDRDAAFRGPPPAENPLARPGVRYLRIQSDEMAPWVGSGARVAYRPNQWPRPGQGCVVRVNDQPAKVRLFVSADEEVIKLRTFSPDAKERLDRRTVSELGAVIARLDD